MFFFNNISYPGLPWYALQQIHRREERTLYLARTETLRKRILMFALFLFIFPHSVTNARLPGNSELRSE